MGRSQPSGDALGDERPGDGALPAAHPGQCSGRGLRRLPRCVGVFYRPGLRRGVIDRMRRIIGRCRPPSAAYPTERNGFQLRCPGAEPWGTRDGCLAAPLREERKTALRAEGCALDRQPCCQRPSFASSRACRVHSVRVCGPSVVTLSGRRHRYCGGERWLGGALGHRWKRNRCYPTGESSVAESVGQVVAERIETPFRAGRRRGDDGGVGDARGR